MINKKCLWCSKKFRVYKCREKSAKFCSISCGISYRNKYAFNPSHFRDLKGKNNPMFGVRRCGSENPMYGKTGELCPRWRGGIGTRLDGYQRKYINEDKPTRELLHRYTMEQAIGRKLRREEVIHHIDGNPSNNDIKNLMLFASQSEHMKYENKVKTSRRTKRGI